LNLSEYEIPLKLLQWKEHLQIKSADGKQYIFDPIRKKYYVLQPEEFVRQLIIVWLINDQKIPRNLIQVEKLFNLHGLKRRFDIVVYNKQMQAYLIVECKSHEVNITQQVFDQISAYQQSIKAPFLMVSNGKASYIGEMNDENKQFEFYSDIPVWQL
jgi:Type I restriction enzyme R protein N terminus (HSDR_N)